MTNLEENLNNVDNGFQIETKGLRLDWHKADAIICELQTNYGHPITNTADDKIGVIKFLRSGNAKYLGNWQHLEHSIMRISETIEY